MENFVISTDSTSDFYADEIEKMNLYVGKLNYSMTKKDGELVEYLDDFKSYDEYVAFYNELRNGVSSKTSILNLQAHIDLFTKMAEDGIKNAIHITQGMGLSPTVTNAEMAIEEVKKTYPDINYVAIESNTTTCAEGYLVKIAYALREKGLSMQETIEKINEFKTKNQHFIVVEDLNYMKRGGRISGVKAAIGTILKVKPIIEFTKEGKLEIVRKENGTKKAYKSIIQEIKANFTINEEFNNVIIIHTDNETGAKTLADMFEAEFNIKPEIRIMGPIVGTHVGPDSVALTFLSNEERKY
ncbi:MAG: DegV family protein [Clostridia bacterium]|nr:DegV family protein [Clostridia bacterium]